MRSSPCSTRPPASQHARRSGDGWGEGEEVGLGLGLGIGLGELVAEGKGDAVNLGVLVVGGVS